MKNFNTEERKVLEMFLVMVFIIAEELVGIAVPEFGEFLGSTPVMLTVMVTYLAYVAYQFIEIYEMRIKESSLHNKEEL